MANGVSGPPIGNNNAAKNKPFFEALNRAIKQRDGETLRDLAEKLLDMALEGDRWAMETVIERMDGKAAQAVKVSGDPDNPVMFLLSTESQLRNHIRDIPQDFPKVGHRTPGENEPVYINAKVPDGQAVETVEPD